MLYFNLLSSDIIKEGTDSKYDMYFSKLSVLPYFKHDMSK